MYRGLLHSLGLFLLAIVLPFCGPSEIYHYFCDAYPLMKLACPDTHKIGFFVIANSDLMGLVLFVVLMASYILILYNVHTYSAESCHKALSTYSFHITVMILFSPPVFFVYIRPVSTLPEDKVFALFYTIIVPMFNLLIYTLKNMEMKNSIRRVWCNKRFWEGRLMTWRSFVFDASDCLLINPSVANSLMLMGKTVRMCKSQAFNNSLPSVFPFLFSSQSVFLDFTFH